MSRVDDKFHQTSGGVPFICDFSPPRGANPELLEPARHLDVDFISVAYNPGKSTRVSSAIAAYWIKATLGKDVVFTIATRDMNKVAIQSLLLGAELLGLENLVIVKGDGFSAREVASVKDVSDYRPTELIRSINDMNQGIDFKGLKLRSLTSFCVGASIDLGRGLEAEAKLTRQKVEAGAHFFISQTTFRPDIPIEFMRHYACTYGEELSLPIFHGIQVTARDGVLFADVPEWVTSDLAKGRSGSDIALQVLHQFYEIGFRSFYLVPPILKGGRRDYDAAQAVLEEFRP